MFLSQGMLPCATVPHSLRYSVASDMRKQTVGSWFALQVCVLFQTAGSTVSALKATSSQRMAGLTKQHQQNKQLLANPQRSA